MSDEGKPKILIDGVWVEVESARKRTLPSSKHLANVGIVITLWASLEVDLHLILRKFLGTSDPKVAELVTATFWQFRIITAVLRGVCPAVLDGEDGQKTKEFRSMLSDIESLGTERGYIAHAVWWQEHSGGTVGTKMKKGSGEVEEKEITVEYLRGLCKRIHDADQKIMNWFAENCF